MPKLTIYANGFKAAKTGHIGNKTPPKRGAVTGWSRQSARRNDEFLKSVDFEVVVQSMPFGISGTFTLLDCPPSAAQFHKLLKEFLRRITRKGSILLHFVIEWHLRKKYDMGPVPHVHIVHFTDDPDEMLCTGNSIFDSCGAAWLEEVWVSVFHAFSPTYDAQYVRPITHAVGWAAYLSKHASRSVENVQRDPDILPIGWHNSGRMWGTRGNWPCQTRFKTLDDPAFYALRHFANHAMIAHAKRTLVVAEARLADSRGYEQRRKSGILIALARARLPFLKRRLRRYDAKIGRIVPICDWLAARNVERWIAACCTPFEQVNPETGEVTRILRLR